MQHPTFNRIIHDYLGERLTVETTDGRRIQGELVALNPEGIHLMVAGTPVKVPLNQVHRLLKRPGKTEGLLVLSSGVLGGVFGLMSTRILQDQENSESVLLGMVAGAGLGAFWGYSSFYEVEVIPLD